MKLNLQIVKAFDISLEDVMQTKHGQRKIDYEMHFTVLLYIL